MLGTCVASQNQVCQEFELSTSSQKGDFSCNVCDCRYWCSEKVISPNVIIICQISHSLSRGGFAEVAVSVGSWYNIFWVWVQYFT